MLKRIFIIGLCGIFAVASGPPQSNLFAEQLRTTYVEASAKAEQSAVMVKCFAIRDGKSVMNLGSGVVLGQNNGFWSILTNDHVVKDAVRIFIFGPSIKDSVEAHILATDPVSNVDKLKSPPEVSLCIYLQTLLDESGSDLALLSVELSGTLIPATIRLDEELLVGEPVIAYGSPFGIGLSMTGGFISAVKRLYSGLWIQTSAGISPGNSGGGLFDLRGQLVGINTMKKVDLGAEQIGFAIDIRTAMAIVEDIIAYGRVHHAYFGAAFGISNWEKHRPLNIMAVAPGSPADIGGIRSGDLLQAIDGVSVSTPDQYINIARYLVAGRVYVWTVQRNGEELSFPLVPVERQ
ncbi:MAG: trypsin-like peptidase domain-containing protein [Candidatus Zixiibacteriota bacterium]